MGLPMTSEQIAAVVEEIRQRVRARYEKQVDGLPDFCVPSLSPLGQARDAAEGKAAAIGSVNPRPPGLWNSLIQGVKKLAARALDWHVREQVEYNRAVVAFMERVIAVIEEQNRQMLALARQAAEALQAARRGEEWRGGWLEWRRGWEERWSKTEIQLLRSVSEMQAAFLHRTTLMEASLREHMQGMHSEYLGALNHTNLEIQKRLWDDLDKLRQEQERLIHTELRLIRQRAQAWLQSQGPVPTPVPGPPAPAAAASFDYARFAERFRGPAEYVAKGQAFYLPFFQGRSRVLDLGCGRGEFLELMRGAGVAARGVDSDPDSVALCRQKGLEVVEADLFDHLASLPDESLDAVFSAQVVEHLPPPRVPELVSLAARKLGPGGLLAIETPNPECLAIFATNFYLDPTHTRPVPAAQLHFYFEENGLGAIEVHQLAPAAEAFAEIAELPSGFQKRFFGGLDYAILGRKL